MFYTNTRSYGTPGGLARSRRPGSGRRGLHAQWCLTGAAQPPALSQTPLPSSAPFVSSPGSGGGESSPVSSPALLPPPSSSVLQYGEFAADATSLDVPEVVPAPPPTIESPCVGTYIAWFSVVSGMPTA